MTEKKKPAGLTGSTRAHQKSKAAKLSNQYAPEITAFARFTGPRTRALAAAMDAVGVTDRERVDMAFDLFVHEHRKALTRRRGKDDHRHLWIAGCVLEDLASLRIDDNDDVREFIGRIGAAMFKHGITNRPDAIKYLRVLLCCVPLRPVDILGTLFELLSDMLGELHGGIACAPDRFREYADILEKSLQKKKG